MVSTMVAVAHLDGFGTGGQRQQLVAQANAEHRRVGFQHFLDRFDGVVTGLGVAGAVSQEHAIRVHRQHLCRRRLRRHHGQAAAARRQHTQDVELHAVIKRDHMVRALALARIRIAFAQGPLAFRPLVSLFAGDFLG